MLFRSPNTNTATAKIAKGLVDYLRIPHFLVSGNHIEWHHVPYEHPIFQKIIGAISVALLGPEEHWWYVDRLKYAKKCIEEKHSIGSVNMWGDIIDEKVKEEIISMAVYKHDMTPQEEEILENILTRKVNTFEMKYTG